MENVKSLIVGKGLIHVHPDATVFEAASMMAGAGIGAMVVLEEGRLVGIFTERDLLKRVIVPGRDPRTARIAEVMTRNVAVGQGDDSCGKCLEIMKNVGCRHLPIVEGDRLIGIISMRDLLMHDNIMKDTEIKMMNYLYYYQAPVMEE
jgi:CBS domain-containing protein